jgi:hypothetical protein
VDGPSLVAAACVPPLLGYCSDAGHVQMEYEVAQCCMLPTEQRSINFIRHYVRGKMNVKNTNLPVFLVVVILTTSAIKICNWKF